MGKNFLGGLLFVGLMLFSANAWAGATGIEGIVTDPSGRTVKGATVRIDGAGTNKAVQSDSKGRYSYAGLTGGKEYRVTLSMNGSVKAQINNFKALPGISNQLNFDLKQEGVSSKKTKSTHMVYIPAETGSNLGGRWVEVNEKGEPEVSHVNRVQRAGGGVVGTIQSNSGTVPSSGN